ncbi:MAG TPA: NAD(P)-binding domain-containing protein [Bacteroidia bacterium]|nr:NAD(P)-binding domain-containing protein [Bacteroidia bacterium]
MKIAVFGTGVVGQTIAEKLSSLGHGIMIGTRNVNDTLAKTAPDNFGRPPFGEWLKNFPGIRTGTYAEAAAFGEFIVNATNGAGTLPALELAGKINLADKMLLDISNPLDFSKGFPPSLSVCNTDSLAEQIQRNYPDTKVVKSLNTMNAFVMVNPGLLPEDHTVFLSGNDDGAKAKVKELLKSFGWKEKNMMDLGDLTSARGAEMLLPIWVRLYGVLKNPMYNFKIVTGTPPQM